MRGGGLWLANDAGADVTVTASSLVGNQAAAGGGIFNDGSAGRLHVVNSTLSGNQATVLDGGGPDVNGTFTAVTTTLLEEGSRASGITDGIPLS